MDTDRDDQLLPVGPGRGAGGSHGGSHAGCPAFDADPSAWFAWLDDAIATGRPIDDAVRTAQWRDGDRTWRVVVTPDGPEIRPALGTHTFASHDLPLISAILVAPPLLHVEITWRHGQEVARVGVDEISLLDLGLAMLTGTELPHEAIARLGAEPWRRARERWQRRAGAEARAEVS